MQDFHADHVSLAANAQVYRRVQHSQVLDAYFPEVVGQTGIDKANLALGRADSSVWSFVPGLFIVGAGIGVMLTSSVNVVQSAFPEKDQGDISGISRSVSNLGSSLGVALAGSVLAAEVLPGNRDFALSLIIMIVIAAIGFVTAILIPTGHATAAPTESAQPATP